MYETEFWKILDEYGSQLKVLGWVHPYLFDRNNDGDLIHQDGFEWITNDNNGDDDVTDSNKNKDQIEPNADKQS